jgi:hypothetical protein
MGKGLESVERLKQSGGDDRMIATQPNHLIPYNYHTILGIHPKPGDETITCEIALDRGRTVKGRVVDPDGKPLAGAYFDGLLDVVRGLSSKPSPSSDFLIEGLGEGASRDVLVYHKERKLAGSAVIGPDESGPITIKLEPCGTVIGRLVEGGRPLAGIAITYAPVYEDDKPETRSLPGTFKTDGDGRFRAEGLAPGRKYRFWAWTRPLKQVLKPVEVAQDVVTKRGETKDLGDLPFEEDK